MRFIDYNGTGGLDHQDIATSISVESAAHGEGSERETPPKGAESNAGCATTMATLMVLPMLVLLIAL